jgi:hypothetical protein
MAGRRRSRGKKEVEKLEEIVVASEHIFSVLFVLFHQHRTLVFEGSEDQVSFVYIHYPGFS